MGGRTQAVTHSGNPLGNSFRVLFWNVENLFDTQNDSLTLDDEFTPTGSRHWTAQRYQKKINDIGKTLLSYADAPDTAPSRALPPAVVGLAEVENARVLRQLTQGSLLRKFGYRFVHYDSPDPRGIDCALLYDPSRLSIVESCPIRVSDTAALRTTRDILFVMATTTANDTLIFFVCHFPSRRGGVAADGLRMEVAQRLKHQLEESRREHPNGWILVMGDFNATPQEPFLLKGLGLEDSTLTHNDIFLNLMADATLNRRDPKRPFGSYCYQNEWSWIDLFVMDFPSSKQRPWLTLIPAPDFLYEYHEKSLQWTVNRTYQGPKYHGGISDHLPICVEIELQP